MKNILINLEKERNILLNKKKEYDDSIEKLKINLKNILNLKNCTIDFHSNGFDFYRYSRYKDTTLKLIINTYYNLIDINLFKYIDPYHCYGNSKKLNSNFNFTMNENDTEVKLNNNNNNFFDVDVYELKNIVSDNKDIILNLYNEYKLLNIKYKKTINKDILYIMINIMDKMFNDNDTITLNKDIFKFNNEYIDKITIEKLDTIYNITIYYDDKTTKKYEEYRIYNFLSNVLKK